MVPPTSHSPPMSVSRVYHVTHALQVSLIVSRHARKQPTEPHAVWSSFTPTCGGRSTWMLTAAGLASSL